MTRHRPRIGYVGVSIPAYYAEKYQVRETAIAALEARQEELGYDLIAIRNKVHSLEETEAAARELKDADIDFLMIQNAACSAGEQLYPLLDVAPKLGLWSVPDPSQDGPVQLSSLVSMNHFASLLKRVIKDRDIPYKWFYGNPDSERFRERFAVTARSLRAVTGLTRSRIGWIGGVSPGFDGMVSDEPAFRAQLGVTVESIDLGDVVDRAKAIEPGRVSTSVGEMRAAAQSVTVSEKDAFDRVARFYLALHDVSAERNFDALAVQCWSTIQELYNVAPCMAYSWLGSEHGFPVACEGDVLGAVSMHMLNLMSDRQGSSTLLDIAALDPDRESMLMWHCGVTPRHFANQDGIRWVDHVTLGRNAEDGPYGVSGDQVFAPQAVTVSYVDEDASQLLVLKSEIVEQPSKGFDGTRGWLSQTYLNGKPIDIWDLLNTLTVRGLQHHFAMGQGDMTRELMELAAWTGMRLVEPVPYADYLQRDGVNA
jgi:L-fucose isomerase-like protein